MFLLRRPRMGAGCAVLAGMRVSAQLRSAGAPYAVGLRAAAQAPVRTVVSLGQMAATLGPLGLGLALRSDKTRLAALTLLLGPALVEWVRRRPPLDPIRFSLAMTADDVAYGLGVWTGCARSRMIAPLMPEIGSRRARRELWAAP
jgi:hypothetical protein